MLQGEQLALLPPSGPPAFVLMSEAIKLRRVLRKAPLAKEFRQGVPNDARRGELAESSLSTDSR